METYTGVDYNMDHDTPRETLPGSMGVYRQVYPSKYEELALNALLRVQDLKEIYKNIAYTIVPLKLLFELHSRE